MHGEDEKQLASDDTERLNYHNPYSRYLELQQFISSSGKKTKQLKLESRTDESNQTIKERETERDGREKYYKLRGEWSRYLIWLLVIMIFFQILLVSFIGFGLLNFIDYKGFLYGVTIESFFQIVGMCFIVVRFLFPQKS